MVGRVVEIATDGRHLSIFRGFLVVAERGAEVGRVAMDEVAAVIANAHGLTYTNNALVELSARGVPIVLCGANHMPAAIVWPVDAHHVQTGRMNDQVSASLPLKKRLWAQLVRAKIQAQGATLAAVGAPSGGFHLAFAKGAIGRSRQCRGRSRATLLAAPIRHAVSPRHGWRWHQTACSIMDMPFCAPALRALSWRRACIRVSGSCTRTARIPMVLIDDLMEPFRPIVDREVRRIVNGGATRSGYGGQADTCARHGLRRADELWA